VPDAPRPARGILDTSVVIDLDELATSQLPAEVAVSVITMAELAAGPHVTKDADLRGRRQGRLQRAEAAFGPLPFDGEAARAYTVGSPPRWAPPAARRPSGRPADCGDRLGP
jgi:hypothetical protein